MEFQNIKKTVLQIGFCYRDKHKIPSGTRLETCRAVGSHAESNAVAFSLLAMAIRLMIPLYMSLGTQ